MTKFLNISTDNTLGGNSPSDEKVASEKAVKGYVDAHSGGSVDIDNKSITQNSSDELQTVGVIDQNATTTAIKTWTGTRTQYNALVSGGTVDSNTLYNITDDTNPTQALLESIYPVGAIYIGTMAICPLSALFGTWTLVSSGRVLQGADVNHLAGTTIEAGLPAHKHYVTQRGDDTRSADSLPQYSTKSLASHTSYNNDWSYATGYLDSEADFLASSNPIDTSIYGNSNTVQPPAFVVNIWKRTA